MTIEEEIAPTAEKRQALRNLCAQVFGTPEGKHLLAALCTVAHPMAPRFSLSSPDPVPAAVRDGRAEIVALLWRYGSTDPVPPPTASNPEDGSEKDRG